MFLIPITVVPFYLYAYWSNSPMPDASPGAAGMWFVLMLIHAFLFSAYCVAWIIDSTRIENEKNKKLESN